ncbi:hemolysin-III related-domain-containing protein [Gigaspora rosea]|uniref:Hemolysin-III related-domain-containing protein n=1 Tax=Gigaspora rosea TaxID=44941 RepID=A0A397VBJ6_9GLOM|nr:hemolysin-III related-domain-containing protein [Gigaspora rosea]
MPLFRRKLSPNLTSEKMSLVNDNDCVEDNFDAENRSLTCSFSELPHWLKDNVDIFTGYRRPTYSYIKSYPSITPWDFLVQYSFLAGVLLCLTFSTLFHSFMCHSEMVCANWNRCDYCGIVFLSIGSVIPISYYAFYCNRTISIIYITLVSVLGIATVCKLCAHILCLILI